jgi:hypothetical protein
VSEYPTPQEVARAMWADMRAATAPPTTQEGVWVGQAALRDDRPEVERFEPPPNTCLVCGAEIYSGQYSVYCDLDNPKECYG